MIQSNNNNIEIARIQKNIAGILGMPQENLVFNYIEKAETVTLELITINPIHEQSFLLHSLKGLDKIEALTKMEEYLEQKYQQESSYTIQWMQIDDDNQLHTSYFRGKNIYDVLDKFYYGREQNSYKIFSINLNPVA